MKHLIHCMLSRARVRWLPLLLLVGLGTAWAQSPDIPAPPLPWGSTPDDIPEGTMIIEGDIIVPIGFNQMDLPWADNFWPNGVVDYEFDGNVTNDNRVRMRNAMALWSAVAQVSWVEHGGTFGCGPIYCVHIQNSNENSSAVGRQFFRQTVNIVNWTFPFIIAHELAHTLGFWHEQSRTDRNTYVRIEYAHIQPGQESNFDIASGSGRYGPYDFDSVMHYGQFDFSRDGQRTITVLPPNEFWQSRIGQRDHLSHWDQLIMGFIYSRPSWRFVDANYVGSESGTFLQPYRSLVTGINNTPTGGTVWIQPGTYTANGIWNRAMTWEAPVGGVTIN